MGTTHASFQGSWGPEDPKEQRAFLARMDTRVPLVCQAPLGPQGTGAFPEKFWEPSPGPGEMLDCLDTLGSKALREREAHLDSGVSPRGGRGAPSHSTVAPKGGSETLPGCDEKPQAAWTVWLLFRPHTEAQCPFRMFWDNNHHLGFTCHGQDGMASEAFTSTD